MQAKHITSIEDILKRASREIELATGSPIVAFLIHKPDNKRKMKIEIRDLQDAISNVFNVEFKDIKSKNRKADLSMARQIFAWFAMTKLRISCVALSEILDRDHSTILYMKRSVQDYISINDPQTIEQINLVETYLSHQLIEHETN